MKKDDYNLKNYISDLWNLVKPYKHKFFPAVFIRLTSDIGRLYPAWALSRIVQILTSPNVNIVLELQEIFVVWGVVTLYVSVGHNLCKYLGYQVAENAALDLYKKSLAHIFKLDFAWQEKENSGNKLKRISKGQEAVDLTIRRIFNVIIEVTVNLVGIIALFLSFDRPLSLALIAYVIIFFLIGTYFLKRAIRQERVVSKSFENLEGFTFEALNNIQTIKALAIDGGVLSLTRKYVDKLIKQIRKRIFYYQSQYGILNFYAGFFRYFSILYLTVGIFNGTKEISVLVLFMGLFNKVDQSAGELTEVIQELSKAKIWLSRTKAILNITPSIENPKKIKSQSLYKSDWKKIRVDNINFSYRKNKALNKISFTINRNEKVGIVGLSGAGKSTLFKLFLDLYENYRGEIFLDDISLKNINRQDYIDHIAVVLQDTELFDMSLKDNIEIASVNKRKDKLLLNEVINKAHLEDVVSALPQGVNTIVGEKGIKLSGGQRQRVGIARALYRQPDILLLDEATSHLDTHSEREIQHAILESVNQFTAIVIAHRLSTIKAMDKIIVMDEGTIVEQGKFDDLLQKNGVFAKMWQEQKI